MSLMSGKIPPVDQCALLVVHTGEVANWHRFQDDGLLVNPFPLREYLLVRVEQHARRCCS